MGCGCKKKQETTTQAPPPTINIKLVEGSTKSLTESQENLVNQIVDKLNQIGEESE
jgi:apolipoprotein N-acyltransferase